MPLVRIGSITDFPSGRGVAVTAGARRLAVFRIGDGVFAIDNSCPHRQFPLHDGMVSGQTVACRTHGSCFNLVTGAVERGPANRGVRIYRMQLNDDDVQVEIPDP